MAVLSCFLFQLPINHVPLGAWYGNHPASSRGTLSQEEPYAGQAKRRVPAPPVLRE